MGEEMGRRRTTSRWGRFADIWIGDVLDGWRAVGSELPDARKAVAEALGFEYAAPQGPRSTRTPGEQPNAITSAIPPTQSAPVVKTSKLGDAHPGLPLAMLESRPPPTTPVVPGWRQVDTPLDSERHEHLRVVLPLEPLFGRNTDRVILATACAVTVEGTGIDVARLVERIAACEPIRTVPRNYISSVCGGIQLLVDRSENLAPYRRDASDLTERLRSVVGRDRSEVLFFANCPTLGVGKGARSSWRPHQPPRPPTVVVVVTDLGMARGSTNRSPVGEDDWLEFVTRTRGAGCEVVVFAPYPFERWPPRLRKLVRAIRWDRSTTASTVAQIAKRRR
jgi:hypothetical protein